MFRGVCIALSVLLSANGIQLDQKVELSSEVEMLNEFSSRTDAQVKRAGEELLEALANSTNSTNSSLSPSVLRKSRNASALHKMNATKLEEQQQVMQKLFAHLKSNIARVNAHEAEGKSIREGQIHKMESRLAHDQAQLKNASLSAFEHELFVNDSRMETNELKYWKGNKESAHAVFHANLKINHGLMSRVKSIMDAYGQALSKGHIDGSIKEALDKAMSSMPPKALLQLRHVHHH